MSYKEQTNNWGWKRKESGEGNIEFKEGIIIEKKAKTATIEWPKMPRQAQKEKAISKNDWELSVLCQLALVVKV